MLLVQSITMRTTVNWSTPLTWFLTAALFVLLLVQVWFIVRNQSLTPARKWVRLGLNGLLWLLLAGYFANIHWSIDRPATHVLLVGDDVPPAVARKLADSLHIRERFSSRSLNAVYDSVTLVGQDFPTETLTDLSQSVLQWVPYNQPDQLRTIRWKGLVRQGEMQRVTARIQSTQKQWLRLRFGRQTVDSVSLREGDNTVALQFPAFARGRSQVTIALGNTAPDTLHYFVRPTQPLTIQFVLNSPDFESKTLANWLGKQGHTITVSATLSTNIRSNLRINKGGKQAPDLYITEPVNASNATIRKAVADGKSVLFINLTNPEVDCRTVNQSVGSRFQVRKTTNEALIPVSSGLNALPYRFAESLNQRMVTGYPVAVQRGSGRVGVSLLSETFPLALSGDSVAYNRIWTAVLARLSPPDQNSIQADAPIFSRLPQEIMVTSPLPNRPATLQIGSDTVRLMQSPLNEGAETGRAFLPKAGWQPTQDSLALYVDSLRADNPLAKRAEVNQFILAHARHQSVDKLPDRLTTAQVPDWVWLLLLIGCFTALWVEPKLGMG
jgi:hypothetical protein